MLAVPLLLLAVIGTAHAKANGAPVASCSSMIPQHYGTTMSNQLRYEIASSSYMFLPTESMAIEVVDKHDDGPIKGVFFQVRDSSDNIVGVWNVGNTDLKTITCVPGNPLSAVTHKNRDAIKASDTRVIWTAPASCNKGEEYKIRATVCVSFSAWTIVEVPMMCRPDYSNVELMEKVRPPMESLYCSQGSWAILPRRTTDGFEKPRSSWKPLYNRPGLRFERIKSPAPGASNPDGLPQASEGDFYMYYKNEGTKKNDMATLVSPFGIQGCFCLSFDYYMGTDKDARFTLSTIGEFQARFLDITEADAIWKSETMSFLSTKPVVFAFQAFSSGAQAGGIGLDNIVIKPGPCSGNSTVIDLTSPVVL